MALNNQNSSPVDEQLLARSNKKSSEKAGQLRQSRRDESAAQNTNEEQSLRQQVAASRHAEQEKDEKEKKEKGNDDKPNAVNSATSRLLKSAWTNLVPSWGLTLIWINIHVFLSTVFGEKFFCKLGMEWVDDNIKRANSEQAKKLGNTASTFEGAGLACLDLGCLLIIIAVLMIVGALLQVVDLPFEFLSKAFGWVWDETKQLISGS